MIAVYALCFGYFRTVRLQISLLLNVKASVVFRALRISFAPVALLDAFLMKFLSV